MGFRFRYTLLGTGVVAAALLVFGWLVYQLVAHTQAGDQDKALRTRVSEAILQGQGALAAAAQGPVAGAEDLRTHTDIFVEGLDPAGGVLTSTAQIDGVAPVIPPSLLPAPTAGTVLATVTSPGWPQLRIAIAPIPDGYLVAGQPISVQAQNLKGIGGFLIVSAIPTLLAAFGATWLVTGRLSRRFSSLIARLEESKAQLGAALEAQRRFVADASHELRTPLTTIRGNAGLLAFGPQVDDAVRSAAARDIASESERMSRLVEQLLTLARADAGQRLELAPIRLSPLVDEVVRQAQTIHPDRRIGRNPAADLEIDADHDALVQLLWILIDNAVKFTPADGCLAIGLEQRDGEAVITVTDDGIGIPVGDLTRIFDRFYQVDASRSARGAGLGLAIARWIVEQHGGTIGAANNADRGSTFTVRLPLRGASLSTSANLQS